MTWIVAKQFLPGYVALFSDVQVTWKNPKVQKDCLKKVYPLANNIVAGFSGSIDIGFHILYDLNIFLAGLEKRGEPFVPRKVVQKWYRRARKLFKKFPLKNRKIGCSIIIAGISPTEKADKTDLPRSDIAILRHTSNFAPKYIPFLKTASIGSGNNVEAYIEFLKSTENMENFANLSKADHTFGGAGEQLAFLASIMLQHNEVDGVSKHVHCTLVSKFGWQQFPLDFSTYDKDDQEIETKMPKVAESYKAFQTFENSLILGKGSGRA